MVAKRAEMSVKEQVRLLSRVDFLEPISEEELKELAKRCPDIHFAPNEIFSTPREDDGRFFVLKKGRVRVYKLGHEGREQVIAEIGAGTGMAARRLHGSYAQTVEPTTIASIGREELKHLVKRNPEVAMRIIEAFARQTRRLDERLADVALREVPARLANLFLQLIEDEGVVTGEGYKIPTSYSQEQLGTMIGAKRVAVSRAFGRLKESGAVELKGRNIYIKNLEALKLAASQEKGAS